MPSLLGTRIAALRKEKKLSGKKLADMLNVTQSYISYIENMDNPSPNSAQRLPGPLRHLSFPLLHKIAIFSVRIRRTRFYPPTKLHTLAHYSTTTWYVVNLPCVTKMFFRSSNVKISIICVPTCKNQKINYNRSRHVGA